MLIVALLIGVVLIVAAIRNSQAALFSALATDAPGYVVWAAALVGVGAIGYIPGLKGISRALLGLVLTVIIINNYKAIIAGFQNADSAAQSSSSSNASSSSSSSGGSSSSSTGNAVNTLTSSLTNISTSPLNSAFGL